MVSDVELAMNVVQLTGVLVPLLLGMTRYYINNQNESQARISGRNVEIYTGLLFLPLLVAYLQSAKMVVAYGNHYLATSVVAYGSFLTLLYAAIPYMLGKEEDTVYSASYIFGILGVSLLILSYSMLSGYVII